MINPEVRLIEPGRVARNYWRDLWHYRELFLVLAWRDVAVRYKQTVIGIAWALIQPLTTMLLFSVVFGTVARMPVAHGTPYALLVLAGLLPWQLFATALSGAANSLIGDANLVSKVYFPRILVPASAMLVALVDLLVSLAILVGVMAWSGVAPTWRIFTLPLWIGLALLASLGPALLLASLNVRYRDFRYVIPFLLQVGLFLSPVGFAASVVPGRWRSFYALNPMVGVIDGFRWAILGAQTAIERTHLVIGLGVTTLLLLLGVRSFRGMERQVVDII